MYLDHNASALPLREVLEGMEPWLGRRHANPSGTGRAGRAAKRAVEEAREHVAALVGAAPEEVIFTSGGTESNNMAIMGALAFRERGAGVLLAPVIEHPSVLEPLRRMKRSSPLRLVPTSSSGVVDPAAFRARAEQAALVCIMHSNNETGCLQPVAEVAQLFPDAHVHCDGVQSMGRVPLDVRALGVDSLSMSGHKLGGPMGVGALWLRDRSTISPISFGGGQEDGARPGTYNLPGIVGMGIAAKHALRSLNEVAGYLEHLRRRLEIGLEKLGAVIAGRDSPRLPNTVFACFDRVEASVTMAHLDAAGITASTGSACSTDTPSHVLIAMGMSPALVRGAVRFSLGPGNTEEEIETLLLQLEKIPGLAPVFRSRLKKLFQHGG